MSYVQVPPDGAGKKIYSKTQTVGSNQVEAQVLHVADSVNPTQLLSVDNRGAASVRFAEGQPTLSGFGSLNVSQKRVLGVYESSSGSYDDLFSIETTSGGTNVYDDVGHGMLLLTDSTSGASVKRTTNRYHYYLPGSSNIMIATVACGDVGKANNTRRWGLFDDNDGVYFELENTTLNVVIRSSTTGSITHNKVSRSNWNKDKLDGTGLSGFNIDITKINVWWLDYQWLGAGRVRFGVYDPQGNRIVCHQFENAGAYALPYMRSGTLPFRSENINTGATGSSSQLRESCVAIYTEGTHEDFTFWRNSDVDASTIATTSDVLVTALQSQEFVPGLNHHNNIVTYPETLNVYTDQPVRIDLREGVTVTGGTWLNPADASLQHNNTATLTDSNLVFKSWFLSAGSHIINLTPFFELNDEGIMRNADGTASVWAITAKRLGSTNANVVVNLGYRELW